MTITRLGSSKFEPFRQNSRKFNRLSNRPLARSAATERACKQDVSTQPKNCGDPADGRDPNPPLYDRAAVMREAQLRDAWADARRANGDGPKSATFST